MTDSPTLLAVLLDRRGLGRYGRFAAAYQKAARAVDPGLGASAPSRTQFHRWTTGGLRGLPYTDHCRVLEHMLAGYTAAQLLARCPDSTVPAPRRPASDPAPDLALPQMAGVQAAFASRSDFASRVTPQSLIDGASAVRAAGLSLNLICQQLPDQYLSQVITAGTALSCLFLDPAGEAIAAREREEEYEPGFLSSLTQLNIDVLLRLRARLPGPARGRLTVAVYDETVRFNILLAEGRGCAVQPYLPQVRGIDSPTLLIGPATGPGTLYPVFDQIWDGLARRSTPL